MSTADECRALSLKVGETIEGREECGRLWHEARLTLLWLGKTEAVFDVYGRSDESPNWRYEGEESNWTLSCRDWKKVAAPAPDTQP